MRKVSLQGGIDLSEGAALSKVTRKGSVIENPLVCKREDLGSSLGVAAAQGFSFHIYE